MTHEARERRDHTTKMPAPSDEALPDEPEQDERVAPEPERQHVDCLVDA